MPPAAFVTPLRASPLRAAGGGGGGGRCATRRPPLAGAAAGVVGRRRRAAPRMEGGGEEESVEARRARFKVTTLREDPLTRRVSGPKKYSKAATSQQNMSFLDAWATKNGGVVVDVWFIVGLLFLLTPFAVLGWGLTTGVIPGLV